MKIGIYEGVDALTSSIIKNSNKDSLNELLSNSFPHLFSKIPNYNHTFNSCIENTQTFLQFLYSIPLPIRSKFTFFVVYGKENSGIPALDRNKNVILSFGMLDCSSYSHNIQNIHHTQQLPFLPRKKSDETKRCILKNVCRKKGVAWKGVGKHILKAVDRYAQEKGIPSVALIAEHNKLISYYKKYGYLLREDIRRKYMIKEY